MFIKRVQNINVLEWSYKTAIIKNIKGSMDVTKVHVVARMIYNGTLTSFGLSRMTDISL